METKPPVVLFDGVCNLCAASVQFLIERDPQGQFRFCSLQSPTGQRLLAEHGHVLPPGVPESVLLLEGGVVFDRSEAALRIARYLPAPWRWLWPLRFMPRLLRDAAYKLIASNRYRLFGKKEACWLPTPALKARFLDWGEPVEAAVG